MSSDSNQDSKQLVELIQQFLTHQVESNSNLNEAAKESLSVATECIETAFNITRKPASTELLDMYRANRENPRTSQAPDPRELIQNLASTFINQVGSQARFAPNFASSSTAQQTASPQSQQQQQQPTTDAQQPQPSAPPKQRKRATEAEKMAAESFKTQGNDFMKQDKYKEAYDCYTRAIEIDDNNAVYYCNRAAASAKLNDHQAALRDCEEALEIDSNYSKAYGRIGLAYASLENHQKAKEAYLKAVELDPTNESYRNNLAIAEEKLAAGGQDANGLGGLGGLGAGLGGLGAAAASAAGGMPNMASMISNMMSNPAVMNMAMRSLQDPRVQNLFTGLASAATQGGAQNPPPNQNNGQPR